MAYTKTWNAAFEAVPDTDLDDVSSGAEDIRDFKTAVRERLAKDHYFDIAGTDEDHGEHSKVTFHEVIATPGAVAGKGKVYIKTVSGIGELHFQDTAGSETQLTAAGSTYSPQSYILDADSDTKVQTEESADEDIIRFDTAGVEQLIIQDGSVVPTIDNDIDLGSTSKNFKDAYVYGSLVQNSVNKKITKSSPAGVSTVTFSSLSAGKMYKVNLYLTYVSSNALCLRFNADTGTNYTYSMHQAGYVSSSYHVVSQGAGSTVIYIAPSAGTYCIADFTFYGIGNNTIFCGNSFIYGSSSSYLVSNVGGWYAGAAGLTSATILSGSGANFTGEIWLEEID